MQNDMLKLNLLLTKEGKQKEGLQQDNILMENDFVLGLKVWNKITGFYNWVKLMRFYCIIDYNVLQF